MNPINRTLTLAIAFGMLSLVGSLGAAGLVARHHATEGAEPPNRLRPITPR
jgi:hypothetical protein